MWILPCDKSQPVYCKCPMGTLSYLCWLLSQKCLSWPPASDQVPLPAKRIFAIMIKKQLELRRPWSRWTQCRYKCQDEIETEGSGSERKDGSRCRSDRFEDRQGATNQAPQPIHRWESCGYWIFWISVESRALLLSWFQPRGGGNSLAGLFFFIFYFFLQDWALELGPNSMLGKCSPMELHPWVSSFLLRYGLKDALPAFGFISSWGCSWIHNPPAKVSFLIAGITDFHHSIWLDLALWSGEL